MRKSKLILFLVSLALIFADVYAQDLNPSNLGSSPYSRYGYGRLAQTSLVKNRGMGGIGYGVKQSSVINPMNPASYTSVDSLTFLFDVGAVLSLEWFREPGLKQSDWQGGVDYLAMQFPVSKRVAVTVGIQPFTYVGYSYGLTLSTQNGNIGYQERYSGDGGLNKAYLGVGVKPLDSFSAGVNIGYVYGDISNSSSVTFVGGDASTTYTYSDISMRGWLLEFGVQYSFDINNARLVCGAVWQPQMKMRANTEYSLQLDTLVLQSYTRRQHPENPMKLGFGLTLVMNGGLTLGADYEFSRWGAVGELDELQNLEEGDFQNKHKYAFGLEYVPARRSRNYYKQVNYRMGMYYSRSYISVNGSQNKEFAITAGLGFPLKSQRSMINLAMDYLMVRPQNSSLLKENYLQLTLGLNFSEMWFFKSKIK